MLPWFIALRGQHLKVRGPVSRAGIRSPRTPAPSGYRRITRLLLIDTVSGL
jgi:hypothetical protein